VGPDAELDCGWPSCGNRARAAGQRRGVALGRGVLGALIAQRAGPFTFGWIWGAVGDRVFLLAPGSGSPLGLAPCSSLGFGCRVFIGFAGTVWNGGGSGLAHFSRTSFAGPGVGSLLMLVLGVAGLVAGVEFCASAMAAGVRSQRKAYGMD